MRSATARGARRNAGGREAAPTAASVLFRDPSGERAKRVKLGFAWDLFLFAPVFGLPLFLRGLPSWGAAVLVLWLIDLFAGWIARGAVGAIGQVALFAAFLSLQFWLGWKGNELTARAYAARGWTAQDQRDEGVRRALRRWRIERPAQ